MTKEEAKAIKKMLAEQLIRLRPDVDDNAHMRAALVLNCDYKVVRSYLAGNVKDEKFAGMLLEVLSLIIEGGNERNTHLFYERNIGRILYLQHNLIYTMLQLCVDLQAASSNRATTQNKA